MADTESTPIGEADGRVPIVSPAGVFGRVSKADLPLALAQGYSPPSPDQLHALEVQEGAQGLGQTIAAGAEGAASALTFGTSPAVETALGITTPEAIAARREAHPIAHGVGTAAGIIAPLVLTGGAAAPAEAGALGAARTAAELTAPALIARAGRAVAGAADTAGLAKLAGTALAGAAEGALYSGADVTEKALLGDPQLTWEKAASEMGLGALFGGALASGADVAAKGLGRLMTKATDGLHSVAAKIAEGDPMVVKLMHDSSAKIAGLDEVAHGAAEAIAASTPETAAFIVKNAERIKRLEGEFPGLTDVLSRAEPDTAKEILNNWSKLLKDPQRRIEIGNSMTDAVNTAYANIEGALRQVNAEVRPAEIGKLAAQADPVATQKLADGLRTKVEDLAKKMVAEPDLFQASARRELELIAEGMKRETPMVGAANASPADTFNLLNRTKQLIDAQAKFGKVIPPEWRRTADALKGLRSEFRSALEDPAVWGAAGERQAAYNAAQSAYLNARKAITDGPAYQKLMQKKVMPGGAVDYEANPRSINSWINLMADNRGGAKSDSFGAYLKTSRNLAAEMEKSGFSGGADLRKLIDATSETANDIRQRGTITQIVKMLQGHEILSSGPAVPMGRKMALEAAKRLPGGVGHIVGSITGTISKVRNPAMQVGVLAYLDKLAKKASTKLSSGVDGIFRPGASGAAAAAGAERFAHGGRVTPEGFNDVAAHLRDLGGNLDRLAGQVSGETSHLQDHAPGAAAAAHSFAARVVGHLGSKLPDAGPRQLLDGPFEPGAHEVADFNRHHEVAQRGPVVVLEHIAKGTLRPEHIEASQAMYPKLHAEAQQLVTEGLAEHLAAKKHVPHAIRGPLSMFLGSDLEHATTPQSMLSVQASYATGEPQKPGAAAGTAASKPRRRSRNVEIHASERLATGSEGNTERMRTS